MAGEACMGEEWATDGVGVLALLKAAFVATSDGTATRSASYAEAGISVGLGGGLLAAGMAAHKAWYSCDGTSVRLGGGRAACPPLPGGLSAFCCWYISSAVVNTIVVGWLWGREDAKRYPKVRYTR